MVLISQSIDFGEIIHLPQANVKGAMSLEESIAKRRSIREFASKPLTIEQIGQLLWRRKESPKNVWGCAQPLCRSTVSSGDLCNVAGWNLSL